MVKSPGFWKRLKKISDFIPKAALWVNDNIIKPIKPVLKPIIEKVAPNYGKYINKAIDYGSEIVDKGAPLYDKFMKDKDYRKQVGEQALYGIQDYMNNNNSI